ncbi:CoB--CoM heterodisulfide reductase iron-sulfur subunit A family protein [candidate division WOR-3 bacterium]|nr:CoB--CoM heterodisulfide reductase iron-sulfur subunit A family protein [candidate division WOR-3 bacterium]
MAERIGVYVCKCGPNIGDKIDVDAIVNEVKGIKNIVTAKNHNLLCSEDGLKFLKSEIENEKLSRIVIAACTPKMYELKFMRVCEESGINPYLMQMTNIREQCAWVTPDKSAATEKAKSFVRAAINRVSSQEPIERKEIEIQPDVLVIGGGVAGLEACLSLAAQKGRKVYLVEKSPCIGGLVVRFEEVYPTMECAPCMLAPELQEVLQKENIETFTYSEIEDVVGSFGNFTVNIRKKARYVSEKDCIGCSACFEPCPVEVPNEYDEGLSKRKAIYIPFAGALPNVPVIDKDNCKQLNGEECKACEQACPFEAIKFDDEDKIIEKKVGGIILATGSKLLGTEALSRYGYGKFDNVLTALQLERLNASNGPTGGKILLKNGKEPKSVAFIYCVGRKEKEYCSGICCMYSIKLAHLLMEKFPDIKIYNFYSDICVPKKEHQKWYNEILDKGAKFIRSNEIPSISAEGEKLIVGIDDKKVSADMIILVPAIEPNPDTEKLAKIFDISQDERGFFSEEHTLMKSFSTALEGVFVVGNCQGPKDIGDAVAQGGAAAGSILSRLVPGEKLELEAIITEINEDLCGGCNTCISLCPYSAISRDVEKKIAVVDETLCRGCGTCVSACPTGAARAKHFTKEQIFAEIKEVAKC